MSKTSPTIKLLTIAILANVSVIAVLVFFYFHIESARGNISSIIDENATRVEEERSINFVKDLVFDTESLRNNLDSRILTKDGIVGFLESVEGYASDVGVTVNIDNIAEEDIEGNKKFNFLVVQTSIEGSWYGVYSFLSFLELLPVGSYVSQARINRVNSGEENTSLLWEGDIKFRVLKYK
ncbi:MAG: hypothetical protein COV70_00190 [Parcubacteria group bacterium CG11_big_fil_rev_8_21_14_0_20_39_22]|nr:MAG: hypothetical protein COV70_00190 [Parcubacteria group bacterium CG11_big_fil_rev_8_21_14_0_20_39_22]